MARMFLAGAKNLESKKEWINELNVFPVPDGDTGTNMTLTIMSAAQEVRQVSPLTVELVSKAISSGSLRGARGNSGVILSQLFRGCSKIWSNETEITPENTVAAFQKAVETAYKAVMKPKEGTILTVAKGGAQRAKELVQNVVRDFVRYHVQDHSIAVGLASDRYNGQFETMKRNPVNNRFFTLGVSFDNQQITVTDEMGQQHHVITTPGLYNNIVREYWIKNNLQRMVSDAVVHLIDSPLMYQEMRPWREVVLEALKAEFMK